jgi:hypothetical protein
MASKKQGDYFSSGESWWRSILIFVGAIIGVGLLVAFLYGNSGG